MTQIKERLELLRQAMKKAGVSACIIPGTDPHAGEYISDYWKERIWISGFTGSAGTAVVTMDKAGLWTDSRYFLQGANQLSGSGIELMKQGLTDTLDIIPWLSIVLKPGEKVAVNPQLFSVNAYANMKAELKMSGIDLVSIDLLKEVWTDRPALPDKPFFIFDTKYSGKTISEKLALVRGELKKLHANVFVLSALDEIAWLFNIRGNDVAFNPLVISYALVEEDKATLFVSAVKCTAASKVYIEKNGVIVAEYGDIYKKLNEISEEKTVLIDGNKLNQSLYEAIPAACEKRIAMSPVSKLKSRKNEVEIAGYRRAMIKDGVALTKFYMWLEEHVKTGKLTEVSIAEKLRDFRAEQKNFIGESFDTIAGYAGHGAIVHYSATPESASTLKPEGILLLDSGGQYLDGTTDITRTITLGKPTAKQKKDYTIVLKGHIDLAMAKYPENTRGSQIDILARKAMWDSGINYGHGTGHGVGHFLNVHEGPQSIRMEENPNTLQLGMVMSNEPGIYRTNEYGMRTENVVLIVAAEKSEFGQFYKFETLTLCFIDTKLIDKSMLNKHEEKWLNNYHKTVYKKLSPFLTDDEKKWLKKKCKEI